MKCCRKVFLALFAAVLLAVPCAYGQNPEAVKLSNTINVLNGNATLPFPEQAVIAGKQNVVKGEDGVLLSDTKIICDFLDARLIFFLQEMPSVGSELVESVAKADAQRSFTTQMLIKTNSLQALVSTPIRFDSTQSAILINRLLVRSDDGVAFTVSAFVNQQGLKNKEQNQRLTERIFSGVMVVSQGKSRNALQEGFAVLSGKKEFSVNVPLLAQVVNSIFKSKKKN